MRPAAALDFRRWGLISAALFMQNAAPARAQVAEVGIEIPNANALLDQLDKAGLNNLYLPFARHALTEAARQQNGGMVRAVVLERDVSLINPRTVECGVKPLAAIIDLDVAPDTPAQMEVERQSGFSQLLQSMRDGGIRIIWIADADEARLRPILSLLREGEAPVINATDLFLVGLPGSYRKQERRWQLAQSHCVVAIAGDRKSDFDELYDYLRDQSYAIRLETFTGRGWFELPHPVAAIDSERLAISPEQKAEE